jgi:hypothetical protein
LAIQWSVIAILNAQNLKFNKKTNKKNKRRLEKDTNYLAIINLRKIYQAAVVRRIDPTLPTVNDSK